MHLPSCLNKILQFESIHMIQRAHSKYMCSDSYSTTDNLIPLPFFQISLWYYPRLGPILCQLGRGKSKRCIAIQVGIHSIQIIQCRSLWCQWLARRLWSYFVGWNSSPTIHCFPCCQWRKGGRDLISLIYKFYFTKRNVACACVWVSCSVVYLNSRIAYGECLQKGYIYKVSTLHHRHLLFAFLMLLHRPPFH